MTRPGIPFQELVAVLERVLSSQDGVEIESPCYLPDKDTGALREHDIVITRSLGHHVIRTAVECKDTGRKVGVPQVEGFAKKCEKTGVHHAVIVSSNGFAETAKAKAAALGIQLMTLTDVERFDWMALDFVVGFYRRFAPLEIRLDCVGGCPEGELRVLDEEGADIPIDRFKNLVERHLKEPADMNELVGVTTPVSMRFNIIGLQAKDSDGTVYGVEGVHVVGSYVVERLDHTMQNHSYVGEHGEYAVSSTDVSFGGVDGKLMFVRDDENIQVVWQPLGPPKD